MTAEFVGIRPEREPLPEIVKITAMAPQSGNAAPESVANTAPRSVASTTPRYRELCRFYREEKPDSCRNGDACRFVHDKGGKSPS